MTSEARTAVRGGGAAGPGERRRDHPGRPGGGRQDDGGAPAATPRATQPSQELQEQVAYLKAFGQACRVQLRAYLEALLSDVETEWGRADPARCRGRPLSVPAQRPTTEDRRDVVAEVRSTPDATARTLTRGRSGGQPVRPPRPRAVPRCASRGCRSRSAATSRAPGRSRPRRTPRP